MTMKLCLIGVSFCMALFISGMGAADATTINGDLNFLGSGTTNFFDPATGTVPSGYGNSSQATAVTVGTGIEFGHSEPGGLLVTADFTANSLVIDNTCQSPGGSCPAFIPIAQTLTFTASTPGFFDGLLKTGDTFVGGVSDTLVSDTLTVVWGGGSFSGSQDATFSFTGPETSATPIPGALPLFASGLGFVGYLARRRKQTAKQPQAAA